MIYEIEGKYYVKVGYEYNEIEIKLDDNGEVTLVPLKNRIEANGHDIKEIVFEKEKQNFKDKLEQKKIKQNNSQPKKYNRSRWG